MRARVISGTPPEPKQVEVRDLPVWGMGRDADGSLWILGGEGCITVLPDGQMQLYDSDSSVMEVHVTPLPDADFELVLYPDGKPSELKGERDA